MSFWSLQFSQKTNLKTQIFALAYWGRNFSFVFWENWKHHKVLSKLTDLYLEIIFNDLSLTRLSQGHRKQKYANGCHFCTLLEKAMQISFVSFFSCLANRTSRYQKIDASWLVNQLHAPYIQCAVGELYTLWCIIKIIIRKFRHFTLG